LVADQSGIALTIALGGSILLLLVGTQVLDWYWLLLLFGGSLAAGIWRIGRRAPSLYALAQHIDARLGFADTLSTAYNFGATGRRVHSPEILEAQRVQADRLARTVDLKAAFPFVLPRNLYAAAGVALVAFGMFAIRYGVTRSLDLRPSLVKIAFDHFFEPSQTADSRKSAWRQKLEEEMKKLGINMNATDAKQDQLDPAPDNALDAIDTPDPNNSGESDTARSKAQAAAKEQESAEAGGDENSERSSPSGSDKNSDQPPDGNDGQPQNGQQASSPKGGKDSNGQNSSLMDKMRDAMANLMNKLKMNSKQGESKQNASQNSQGAQQQGKSEKGQMAGKQQQSSGSDAQDQQGEQAQGDQSQNAKGKSGERNADQASQDAKSGIGKQDGDKSAKEAEQLAAMGKISEILGKRAKDMSGEVMVEVSSGKQQLKTQYSSQKAAHAEAGGEISRDEVPLEYQSYVQQYFEQIRKLPPAPAAKKQ
jgi:hypothetical protein